MTPIREAMVLPAVFLTVALLGGLRVGNAVTLVPPSLSALVLAVLVLGTLVRSRAFEPVALMHRSRSILENASGTVVLLTLAAASAQAINTVLPERGLLHAGFAVLFFCQLMTMNATASNRIATVRGLLVLFGSLFVLRYIVIEALYARDGGLLHRVFTAVLSGASMGGIAYQSNAPINGYIAFFTLGLYVMGLLLLPTQISGALIRNQSDVSSSRTRRDAT